MLPHQVRDVLATVADLSLTWLPEAAAADLELERTTRLADYTGVCRLLFEEGRRRNLTTRTPSGLALAPPLAVPHHWAEFRFGGIWVPVDPGVHQRHGPMGVLDRAQMADAPAGWRDLGTDLVPPRIVCGA